MAASRPRRNRIVIGLPLYAPVSPRWLMNWLDFQQQVARYDRHAGIYTTNMSYHELAMNTCVQKIFSEARAKERPSEALGILRPRLSQLRGYGAQYAEIADELEYELTVRWLDYILFIESDNVLPDGVLEKIATLDPKTHQIVGFNYHGRTDQDLRPVAGKWEPDGTWHRLTYEDLKPMRENRGFHEVGSVGMGCTAIHRSVFEHWPENRIPAWFHSRNEADGFIGHDVIFCKEAKDFGLVDKVWLNTELKVGHLGEFMSTEDNFFDTHEHMLAQQAAANGRESERAKAKADFLAGDRLGQEAKA